MDKEKRKKRQNKKYAVDLARLPVVVFFGVLLACMVVSAVMPKSDFSEAENRALQEFPEISLDGILEGDVQESYEEYLSDQFFGRESFVSLCTNLKRLFGRKDINGVYLGEEDYLLEKYHASDFDKELVEDNVFYLSGFLGDYMERLGREHVRMLFVPSKGAVLSAYMPKYADAYNTSYVPELMAEELSLPKEATEVLDLTGTLKEHEKEYIYYRTDHHWTTLGAYYAYAAYRESLKQSAPPLKAYEQKVVAKDFLGTSYDKIQRLGKKDEICRFTFAGEQAASPSSLRLNFDDGEMVWDSYYDEESLSTKDKYSYFLGGNTAKIHIETGADNDKTLLLLKDSFSNSFVEFLERDYAHIYMLDLRYTEGDIYDILAKLDEEHRITDVLVMYNIEKFMQDDNMWKLEKGQEQE